MNMISTYRIQLREDGPTFKDVEEISDYLSWLGISHVYLSPVFKARKGSTHGYDVVDYVISDRLGGREGYERMSISLKDKGIGILQDVVPNHMAVSTENWRLMDVLRKGRNSKWSSMFDWWGDVITLPILEDKLGKVKHLISINKEKRELIYRDWRLPLCDDVSTVDETLRRCYHLTWWIEGPSYRRFFYVNCLIGVNAEREEVLQEQIRNLPKVDGIRIDHIDGLFDPVNYVKRMKTLYPLVLVEKILTWEEKLEIPADGTTGYDFMNYVNHLLIDGDNHDEIERLYEEFTGKHDNLDSMIRESKRAVIRNYMKNEFSHVAKLASSSLGRDVSEDIFNFAECLPVYRVYSGEYDRCDPHGVVRELREKDTYTYNKLQQILPGAYAKGIEDTVFYRFIKLLSINEVGGFLERFGITQDQFHSFISSRQETTMNSTSTHDTKVSEDVRARIDYLSEIPDMWSSKIKEWRSLLRPKADPIDEYRFYQVLVGSLENFTEEYKERLKAYMIKAMRESKEKTTWEKPNLEYEEKVIQMVEDGFSNDGFRNDVSTFVKEVDLKGKEKSLAMITLKIMTPGIADFYQGTETWRYLLVDPDNRLKVDFRWLNSLRDETPSLDLGKHSTKTNLIRKLLKVKREIYGTEYKPLKVDKGYLAFKRGSYTVIVRTLSRAGKLNLQISGFDVVRGTEVGDLNEELSKFPVIVMKN